MLCKLADPVIGSPHYIQQEIAEAVRLVLDESFQGLFVKGDPVVEAFDVVYFVEKGEEQFYVFGVEGLLVLEQLARQQVGQELSCLLLLLRRHLFAGEDFSGVYIEHQREDGHCGVQKGDQCLAAIVGPCEEELFDQVVSVGEQQRVC